MTQIDKVLKEAKWITAEDWMEKKVRNPATGRTVKVKSLPKEEREKYKPKKSNQKEKLGVPEEHHEAFDKLDSVLKDFAPTTSDGGPKIKNFLSLGGSDYVVIDFPPSEKRRMFFHMENKGLDDKVHFPNNSTMQFYFKK